MNIQIAIKFDAAEIAAVGSIARCLCVQSDVDDSSKLNQVELSVVELLKNIIEYAVDIPVDGLITLHCCSVDSNFKVTVSDGSKEISKEVAKEYSNESIRMPSLDIGIGNLPESGWGIQLIKTACDKVSYKRSKNSNVYELYFDLSAETV